MSRDAEALLALWFDERGRRCWFEPDPDFDAELRQRFAGLVERALAGELAAWDAQPESCLALLLLLDQLPRNLWREDRRAFAGDAAARRVAAQAVERGFDRRLPPDRRLFVYLPFQHGEDPADQRRSVRLIGALRHALPPALRAEGGVWYEHALQHQAVIERFGRFPHRNARLGRSSTEAEESYLAEGGGF
jgi:uncharacterized protein (DUF924 family)